MCTQPFITGASHTRESKQTVLQLREGREVANDLCGQFDHGQRQI